MPDPRRGSGCGADVRGRAGRRPAAARDAQRAGRELRRRAAPPPHAPRAAGTGGEDLEVWTVFIDVKTYLRHM